MSLAFNDTTNRKGIVQFYEKEIGANRGDVSSDINRLKDFAADVNLALDSFFAIAIPASGRWQLDDSNHDHYPIITTNLVSGQRSYTVLEDEDGNLVLDIYRVMAKDDQGVFQDLTERDMQTDRMYVDGFNDGQNLGGVPTAYDKTANGIFLDRIPNYNATGGLKLMINREPQYFEYTDTTKRAGIPGWAHAYLYLKPAEDYARRNTLNSYLRLKETVTEFEEMIKERFALRGRDAKPRMRPSYQDNK